MLALAALVALALSASPVGAKPVVADNPASQQGAGSANNPKASIQQGNLFCGADRPDLPVIGFSNYHRSGNTVSVDFHLKNAMPKANYRIELWGNSCSFFGIAKTVKTNSQVWRTRPARSPCRRPRPASSRQDSGRTATTTLLR